MNAVGTFPVKTERDQFLALLRQVEANSRTVADTPFGFSTLHESIMQMEKQISAFDGDESGAAMIMDELTPKTISGLNDTFRKWKTTLELEFAHRVIQGEAVLSDYCLYERIGGLVRRELAMVSAIPIHRILVIGSGPLPASAIHIHLQTGLIIDCVGRDQDAIAMSERIVRACGLNESIRVFSDNNAGYNVLGYDLVVIEIREKQEKNLLTKLRKRCQPGCHILYRTSHGLRRLLHEGSLDSLPHGFHVKGWQIAQGEQTISTCLLEPAKSAAADVRLEWVHGIDAERGTKLLRLMNRTLEEETTIGFPGPLDHQTGSVLMQQLNADVMAGRRHVLVAEKDGVAVGQLILTPNVIPNHQHIVELTRGTIDRSFRGGGLALRAFQEVATKCEELGRDVICLDVRAGTLAAIWWQHFGFKPYGLLTDYSRVGDKTYAGLFLSQTTTELKQRVREIASSQPAATPAT
jgi:hypothetical protein